MTGLLCFSRDLLEVIKLFGLSKCVRYNDLSVWAKTGAGGAPASSGDQMREPWQHLATQVSTAIFLRKGCDPIWRWTVENIIGSLLGTSREFYHNLKKYYCLSLMWTQDSVAHSLLDSALYLLRNWSYARIVLLNDNTELQDELLPKARPFFQLPGV